MTVAYDRNSSITSTDESLATGLAGEYPAKRDAKFTMDELNRLMRAQEGTLTSGSISTTYRDERWQDGSGNLALSQTGNWTRRRLDLSGDGVNRNGAVTSADATAFNAAWNDNLSSTAWTASVLGEYGPDAKRAHVLQMSSSSSN